MAQVQSVDEFVKEFLLFRGFTSTLKAFDNELKIEKDKGFRVDRIVDSLLHCVSNYDLIGLRDSWNHLETKVFTRLDHHFSGATKKLEHALLKYYLVHAIENSKSDKVAEFFSKMTQDLGGQPEWKDWFTIPYIKYPEENATFAVFFTRQWQESLFVSLHNYLASVYQNLPQPTLSAYEESAAKITLLQKENEILRRGLANRLVVNEADITVDNNEDLSDIMDDFYNLSQEVKASESQSKTLKSLMKIGNSGLSVSPKAVLGTTLSATPSKNTLIKHITGSGSKRSSSIDARGSAGGRRDRDRDLSQDPSRSRIDSTKLEKGEGSFLFLSQDEYSEHACKVKQLKLNGRGNMVASLDSCGNLRVWTTPPSCRTVAVFPVRPQADILEWVLHNERYLLCADPPGPLRLLDVKEVTQMWETVVPIEPGSRLDEVISNPSESSALLIVKGKVLYMDLKSRKIEKTLPVPSLVTSCAFTPNGQLAVCGCMDGSVHVVDLKRNDVIGCLPALSAPVVFVHLTFDGSSCFYLGSDRKLLAASLSTKEKVQSVTFPAESQLPVIRNRPFCLDSSGTFLLTLGTNSGVIYKLGDESINKCLELGGHKHSVTCIDWCFANQCATCVTASSDGNIRISTLLIDTVSTANS